MKTGWLGPRRYEMGVGMTILSSTIKVWSMVIFHHIGYQFASATRERLLKQDQTKRQKASIRASAAYRKCEAKRRNQKRKNNRSKKRVMTEELSAPTLMLPYANQNHTSEAWVQQVSGICFLHYLHPNILNIFCFLDHPVERPSARYPTILP